MADSKDNSSTIDCKDVFSRIEAPGNKGAAGELIVCVDLMSKGYMVFRAVHPNSPYDLIAVAGDRLFRIEVKIGQKSSNGSKRNRRTYRKYFRNNRIVDDYDAIATVHNVTKVTYTSHSLNSKASDVKQDNDLIFQH